MGEGGQLDGLGVCELGSNDRGIVRRRQLLQFGACGDDQSGESEADTNYNDW